MPRPSSVTSMVDEYEKNGVLNVRVQDLMQRLPTASPTAVLQALQRLQQKGRIVPVQRGSGHWLIVPLRDAHNGAPPIETWLHSYLAQTLQVPYYVGLLSAAEAYGASPYAVMKTQVFVPKPRRALAAGRHVLSFFSKQSVADTPSQWHETADGRFRISSPEVTAMELIQRQSAVGGIGRTVEVLKPLFTACSSQELQKALDSVQDVAAAQKLGALLYVQGHEGLVESVRRWLESRRTRPLPLAQGYPWEQSHYIAAFQVYVPRDLNASV